MPAPIRVKREEGRALTVSIILLAVLVLGYVVWTSRVSREKIRQSLALLTPKAPPTKEEKEAQEVDAEPRLTKENFNTLPPLPSKIPLEGKDEFKALMPPGGQMPPAYAVSPTNLLIGDTACPIPVGTEFQVFAQRGRNFYLALLNPPCRVGGTQLSQGYVQRKDVRISERRND